MTDLYTTETKATRAWVLHPDIKTETQRRAPEHALAEAVSLAVALPDLVVAGEEVVRLPRAHPGMLFGAGKIEELGQLFKREEIELVLIDGPVTPVQQRNLERAWKVKLLDRTGLILEIFSDRAATREGVLQVEMAHLSYQRTRLVRAWTHLERQRGGLGFVGGPGETQIEADRRAIDDQLGRLRRQLSKVVKTRTLHRSARAKVPYPIVALVGYTNAGKSTLFNRLTGAEVMAKDMLFATLDPTMRAVQLPDETDVILSDTVGFISDLPTELVAAFRATLEEVTAADLILHVRDISHPETEEQAADVADILGGLGIAEGVPLFEVWNKTDGLEAEALEIRQNLAAREENVFLTSALTGEGLPRLLEAISSAITPPREVVTLALSHADGKKRAWLYEQGVVQGEDQTEAGPALTVEWTATQAARYGKL
ncbi:MAG: GTPase HflX [Pseudomonadota bacterium]